MKKLSIILTLILISSSAKAQWERRFQAGVAAGYEWNIFLNPTTLLKNGVEMDRSQLWENALYERLFMSASFTRELENSRFKLNASLAGGNYHSRLNANRYSFSVKASYRTKYARKKYFELAPEVARIKQDGVNEADAVLRTPFSYVRFTLPLKFDFYLGNKVWFKTTTGYIFKNYDRDNGEQLYYHAGFAEVSLSKKWQSKTLTTKLTFSASAELRSYQDIRNSQGTDGQPALDEQTRSWNYFRTNLEYDIKPAHERFGLTLGIYGTRRADRDTINSYQEWAPGAEAFTMINKVRLSANFRYSVRNYGYRLVGTEQELLQYNYLRSSIKAEMPLGKKLRFFVKGNLVDRLSNNDVETTRGFRGYFNSKVETGLTIRF